MKRTALLIAVMFVFITSTTAVAADLDIETGLNINYWDSDGDDSGNQLYVPVTIGTDFNDFSVGMLTSFAYTESDSSMGQSRSLSSVTDTKLNLTYTLADKLPIGLIFGLDFNLPTGKTKLDRDEQSLLLDPDLVAISQFGEGFNVNPTIGFAKVGDNSAIGFGVGYLLRGEFDYSEDITDYEPGNILSITGEVVRYVSSDWKIRAFGMFAQYGKDKVKDQDYYEESDFLLLGAETMYYQDNWEASLSVEGILRGKSKFQEDGVGLLTEDRSSYGDEYDVTLSWRCLWSEKTTIKGQMTYLWVNENDYSQLSSFYIGDRSKASFSVSFLKKFGPSFSGTFSLGGYILDVDRNWYHSDDRSYKGITAGMLLTKRF